ncbi:MAG: hypothetical protein PHC45_00590 [Clostridiaceae bacterium]|nr:hypothetical protein [Clostridiaceae bacterium]
MTMRPVDLQTTIPKLPEVQKVKNAEIELEKNNLNINIHKEQQQNEQNTKHVVETKKAQEARINKDDRHNKGQGNQKDEHKGNQPEDNEDHNKNNNRNPQTRIDIRI